jgi:hypothetical protein
LSSGKVAFGDKKAFNMKTMLISIPQLVFLFFIVLGGIEAAHGAFETPTFL